ncbi:MAG: heparan N-sulfatase [Planctomycetota bacterium]|nr:MAG: heparan N-sulfatase [Planctomycetota bacterium]
MLAATCVGQNPVHPNVIVFIADDVSWNDYGCYGNPGVRTPHIDQLATDGIQFLNAYLTASSCSPSRASIITGRYPHNTGRAAELHLPIASNLPWFPELLRQAGYYTVLSGKNHMSVDPEVGGESRPPAFDVIDPGRAPGNSGGHARWVQHVRERPRDQPLFAWFAAYDAHRGWDADREWRSELCGPPHEPDEVIVPPFLVDDAATRRDLASYYNEITRFDYFVGQVVEELRRQEALEDTLIFVLADNGRPFPRAKTRLHDSGMKTALIAHWPHGIPRPARCRSLVSVIDLAPTILTAAGVQVAPTMQGVPLQPLFQDPSASVRQFAFSEHNWHDYEAHGRAVRDGQFLYIRNARPELPWQGPADSVRSPSHRSLLEARRRGALNAAQNDVFLAPRPREELYVVGDDPHQINNLVDDPRYEGDLLRMRQTLDRWIEETGDSVPERLSQDAFDRESGERLPVKGESYRGTPPGFDRQAYQINAPGPR